STTMKQGKEGPRATVIRLIDSAGLESRAGFRSSTPPKKVYDPAVEMETEYHEHEVTWTQVLRVPKTAQPGPYTLKGSILHQLCNASTCLPPLTVPFEVKIEVSPDASLGTADFGSDDLLVAAATAVTGPEASVGESTQGAPIEGP